MSKEQLLAHAHAELEIKEVFIPEWNETFYVRGVPARLRYWWYSESKPATAPLLAVALTLCDKSGNLTFAQVTPDNIVIPPEDFEALGRIPSEQLSILVEAVMPFFYLTARQREDAKKN